MSQSSCPCAHCGREVYHKRDCPHGPNKGEASQEKLIKEVRQIVRWWSAQTHIPKDQACEGVAFSILVTLDGEGGLGAAYAVRELGEDGTEGGDIAGKLHDSLLKP